MMNRRAALKSLTALAGVAIVGAVPSSAQSAATFAPSGRIHPGLLWVTPELLEDSAIDLSRFHAVAYNCEFDYWEMVSR